MYFSIDYELIAEEMLAENYSHDEIVDYLVKRGLERYSAQDVLADAIAQDRQRLLWRGLAVVVGGFILVSSLAIFSSAITQSHYSLLYYSAIPLVFGFSLMGYGLRKRR